MTRCQCDDEGVAPPFEAGASLYNPETEWPYVTHAPGMCECVNDLKLCTRNGKTVWLCSNCIMSGDEEVENLPVSQVVDLTELPIDNQNVYVLIYENGYDDTQVAGVFTSKNRAARYVREYVDNHDGKEGDNFRVVSYTLDRLYTE